MEVTEAIVRESARLAEAYRLRAYDAVHLASAKAVHGGVRESFVFASWDLVIEKAAKSEGFALLRLQ